MPLPALPLALLVCMLRYHFVSLHIARSCLWDTQTLTHRVRCCLACTFARFCCLCHAFVCTHVAFWFCVSSSSSVTLHLSLPLSAHASQINKLISLSSLFSSSPPHLISLRISLSLIIFPYLGVWDLLLPCRRHFACCNTHTRCFEAAFVLQRLFYLLRVPSLPHSSLPPFYIILPLP